MRRLAITVGSAAFLVASLGATARASRLSDKAIEIGPGITPPAAVGLLVIETPEGVADRYAHATVTVRVLLDKSGWVRSAEAIDSPDPRLAAAAVEQFENGSFSPATREKKPVVVWFNKKVVFRPKTELDAEIPSADCVPAAYDPNHLAEITADVELPRILLKVEPVYPPDLRQDRIEGQAWFACIIDTCGHVRDCRVLNSTRGAFARAGMDAVVLRRYVPARRDGKPIASQFTIAVTFNAR